MMFRSESVVVLAGLLGLSGCLYLDGINDPPEARMVLVPDENYIYIGDKVWINASGTSDAQDPMDRLHFRFDVEHTLSPDSPSPQKCAAYQEKWEYCFIAGAKVEYRVTLRVTDDAGAVSWAEPVLVVVNNRDPVAECRFDTFSKPNNHFIVGREVWMTGVESFDQDEGDVLSYHWEERLRPTNSLTADFVMQRSDLTGEPTSDPEAAVRLLVIPDVPGSYEVGLRVADVPDPDPDDLSNLCQLFFEVDPDEEPCIASTSPDFATGTLVFDRFDVRRLEVTQVTDDLDPFPGSASGETDFQWQIEEAPGAGFMDIPGYGFSYLDLDGGQFALNQWIRVRVVALDRAAHDLSSCPVTLATCALRAGCFQWVTWDIEFR
jgi:hypothetical protein